MNPLLLKPAAIAAILGVIALVSFGAGFAVENWRKGAEVERVRGENALLNTTNGRCLADVRNVRAAMSALQAEAEERARLAGEAMKRTEPEVKTRTVTITKIKELPPLPLNMQCEAIKEEQIEYVKMRRGA